MDKVAGQFYLGREMAADSSEISERPLHYDPDDLLTHAVVVGMTGSGKTGLCIDLLEEAALNDIPSIMIDPKGDITNALLHFPDLTPADFQPWINPTEARREGQTVEEAAAKTAANWRNGLAEWDIQPERIRQLADSVQFAVYTPGSDAGLSISILASLAAPQLPWEANKELLREQISGTVTALLGLIGLKDIDPVRSREHILLCNIFEHNWSQGSSLDLATLILQVQTPSFPKLGIFDVNTFFPEKDRFGLAMLLNNILAAPTFQSWIEGEPLDMNHLLHTADGRSRHTIFYIAHLPDSERMFFVTLLFSAVETWMRTQSGTTSLRALIYFDEIFGYLPPVSNPPSKEPMLRLLKQARAFGVGLVLATQNPADISYKGLSNAGTWFIGKLATDQDKHRLLDGLTSIGSDIDRAQYDRMISSLGKRVFLLRNVHSAQPVCFHTRWAMNYLAGPVTREQIPALNALAQANDIAPTAENGLPAPPISHLAPPPAHNISATPETTTISQPLTQHASRTTHQATKSIIPRGINEYFLPNNLTIEDALAQGGRILSPNAALTGIRYQPMLLAQAVLVIRNRKYNVDVTLTHTTLQTVTDPDGRIRWQDDLIPAINRADLPAEPLPLAQFEDALPPLTDLQLMRKMQQDFVDWLYQHKTIPVRANENLAVYAGPQIAEDEFRKMCMEAAEPRYKAEAQKVAARHDRKIDIVRQKLKREQRELEDDQDELSHRKHQEALTHAKTVFTLFRRNRIDQSLNKRRMTQKAHADVKESLDEVELLQREIDRLEVEKEQELDAVEQKWLDVVDDVTETAVTPFKKDIDTTLFGIAWMPQHLVEINGTAGTIPAFQANGESEHDSE